MYHFISCTYGLAVHAPISTWTQFRLLRLTLTLRADASTTAGCAGAGFCLPDVYRISTAVAMCENSLRSPGYTGNKMKECGVGHDRVTTYHGWTQVSNRVNTGGSDGMRTLFCTYRK